MNHNKLIRQRIERELTVASHVFEKELQEVRNGILHLYTHHQSDPLPTIEDTQLYNLIIKASKVSLREAWRLIPTLEDGDINIRSTANKGSFLHVLINIVPTVVERYGDVSLVIPLLYRLALQGIRVNALNEHGNSAMHLACIRPHAQSLCIHLLRIGVDPTIANNAGCRIVHTYKNHKFTLVKGEDGIKAGLWNAVKYENETMVEKLLKTWCRVNVCKNKTLQDVAEATSNIKIIKLLERYLQQNEFVCSALACDVTEMRKFLENGHIQIDVNTSDAALDVPIPLFMVLESLGDIAQSACRIMMDNGVDPVSNYLEKLKVYEAAFEESEFFKLIEANTEESILKALDIVTAGKVQLNLVSHSREMAGWTYLHYVVDKYIRVKKDNEEKSRLLIRAIYRLALAGIDVHARDHGGATALAVASVSRNQELMRHLLRIGCDSSKTDLKGRAVTTYIYEDRGKLVFDSQFRHNELPGLWVAVDANDIPKLERWLRSWGRVNVKRGDRTMLQIAKARGLADVEERLSTYEHINEFVCATFACDLKYMKFIIALGKGGKKVNTIDEFFHVGYTWDRHAEYLPRPIIITAMELCSPDVVDFLLSFGANLSKEYEESAPCGPTAFWAFRDHVSNANAAVVARYADVALRDELGCTLLHRAVQKTRLDRKVEIVQTLLDRGVNIADRDWEGSTARDYLAIFRVPDADVLRQTIDDFVLNLVNDEQYVSLEALLLDAYDHVLNITGVRRKHMVTARDIAVIKEYKEIIELLDDWQEYRETCDRLHQAAKLGDSLVYKISGEKKCSISKDKAGRSLLHQAALYEHKEMVAFLVEQYPHLINTRDNLNRIPLNLCVCTKTRSEVWPILQDGGADPNLVDVNGFSNYDYVRELETPTSIKDRPPGRRWRDYRPQNVLEWEKTQPYGEKATCYENQRELLMAIEKPNISEEDILVISDKQPRQSLDKYGLDVDITRSCVDHGRWKTFIYLCKKRGARIPFYHHLKDRKVVKLVDYVAKRGAPAFFLEYIHSIPLTPDTPSSNASLASTIPVLSVPSFDADLTVKK